MKIQAFKSALASSPALQFKLPSGAYVPAHFHITEVGLISRHFIDCGGVIREHKKINLQLYQAQDYDHRLSAAKLNKIIGMSEKIIGTDNHEVEIEYQGQTIEKYHVDFDGQDFLLLPTHTDCLAKDDCGITDVLDTVKSAPALVAEGGCCTPESGCC